MTTAGSPRQAAWSGAATGWLATRIPSRWRPAGLTAIRVGHTAVFLSVAACILLFAWDGARGRSRRRAAVSAVVALAETAVYASNNQVCPLSPLAEELGAANGSVTDILLPDWISRRIPLVFGSLLALGLALHSKTLAEHRGGPSARPRPTILALRGPTRR